MEHYETATQLVPSFGIAESRYAIQDKQFLADVHHGLSKPHKTLDCKYLYDQRGSMLFDRICELEEYYPTRVESRIMRDNAWSIGRRVGSQSILVELGSGSSLKTRLLLSSLHAPTAYLPVDISEKHLLSTASRLQQEYPGLEIKPVVADFTQPFDIPERFRGPTTSAYFPGSTIGNLEPPAAIDLLTNIADLCGEQGGLLIGFDLIKDVAVLERAYNDGQGVTAAFNLNLLRRMNRELHANFVPSQFAHCAYFNSSADRIEIYIESLVHQTVEIDGREYAFQAGERILTEYSHKYSIESFQALAAHAGLEAEQVWTDAQDYFAVMYLTAKS